MDPITVVVIVFSALVTLVSFVYCISGHLEIRAITRQRLEREARRAAVNAEHEANMRDVSRRVDAARREVRRAAKPILFHKTWCPFPRTATCLCGRETYYSPTARAARGELVGK